MRIMNEVQDFFVHKRIISAVKRVEFVSDRMSYIILRGLWCHIIVLNVHARTEEKTDDVKVSFYGELERVFDQLPNFHMKISAC
jgi:predicted nucleotidyltransferase